MSPRPQSGRPTRTASRAAVKLQLLVYLAGTRTEEDYLVYWSRLRRTQVRVTIAPERSAPATLIDLAVQAKTAAARDEKRGRGTAWDEIWCMFDEDAHPGLEDAIARATAHDIKLAVTSPCIELWFILHFEDQTAHIDRHQAQSRARRHLSCDKRLTDDALDMLDDHYDQARTRAIALDAQHAGDGSPPRSNPSSEVWKLVDRIHSA